MKFWLKMMTIRKFPLLFPYGYISYPSKKPQKLSQLHAIRILWTRSNFAIFFLFLFRAIGLITYWVQCQVSHPEYFIVVACRENWQRNASTSILIVSNFVHCSDFAIFQLKSDSWKNSWAGERNFRGYIFQHITNQRVWEPKGMAGGQSCQEGKKYFGKLQKARGYCDHR